MNLSLLPPAPWAKRPDPGETRLFAVSYRYEYEPREFSSVWVARELDSPTADFLVLARAAYDVMTRRGWGLMTHNGKFAATMPKTVPVGRLHASGSVVVMNEELNGGFYDCPFTALVEADLWQNAHEPPP